MAWKKWSGKMRIWFQVILYEAYTFYASMQVKRFPKSTKLQLTWRILYETQFYVFVYHKNQNPDQ